MYEPLISIRKKCPLFVTRVKGITFQTSHRRKEDELYHEVVQIQENEDININEDEVSQSHIQVHERERSEN